MTESTRTVRMGQVAGRLLLDLQTAEEIGHVGEILVDSQQHQVVGFTCRTGMMRRERPRFGWDQVSSVGKDGLILKGEEPMAEDFTEALPVSRLEVWSDAGERIGWLADFEFDSSSGAIQRYLFSPEGWRGLEPGLYAIAPAKVVSAGRRRMMVRAEAVNAPQLVEAGAPEVTPPAAETQTSVAQGMPTWRVPNFPEDLHVRSQQLTQQARDKMRDQFQSRSQEFGRQAQDQWQERSQQLADQAKGQFNQVMGRFRKRSRRLRHQIRETVADWSDEISPKGPPPNRDRSRHTIDVEPRTWPEDSADSSQQP